MRTIGTPEERNRLLELERMKQSLEKQLAQMAKTVELQQQQIAMAGRDTLTGLRNRAGVAEQINNLLKKGNEGTFFIMDMDNFKAVNDTYGHVEGDRVLVRFANALRDIMEPNDILARIGGDEFIIFTSEKMSREMIRDKAARIVRHVGRKIVAPGKLVRVTVSMGIAVAPKDGVTFESLYQNGDVALYSVKNDGKNAFRFYDEIVEQKIKKNVAKVTLSEITSRIKEKKMEGSFVVEYESFEKIYRFLERNIARENRKVQCVLFTVDEPEDKDFDEFALQRQMEHLQHAVVSALRRGDVITNYSESQMLVLIMDVDSENADLVVKRILERYKTESGEDDKEISYEIQQLIPEEDSRKMTAQV